MIPFIKIVQKRRIYRNRKQISACLRFVKGGMWINYLMSARFLLEETNCDHCTPL